MLLYCHLISVLISDKLDSSVVPLPITVVCLMDVVIFRPKRTGNQQKSDRYPLRLNIRVFFFYQMC